MQLRNSRRPVVVTVLVVLVALVTVPNAIAYHDAYFGSNWAVGSHCDTTVASQCIANDAAHHYTLSGLSTARADATTRGFVTYGGNSDLNVSTLYPWDVIVVQEYHSDIDAYAWTRCAPQGPYGGQYGGSEANHTRWCSPQYIVWNTWETAANKVNSTAKYNFIGCHESGHTVGLRHRSTSPVPCMRTGAPPSSSTPVPTVENPTSEEYTRINLHY